MTNGREITLYIVDNQIVEYVQDYVYLGQVISVEKRQDREIARRILNFWSAFWKLKLYLLMKTIHMKAKKRLFEMYVLSIFKYGSQMWSLTKAQTEKLLRG